jgi:hypothetical protein
VLVPKLNERIAEHERSFSSIDKGCCYVVLDDRALLERVAHYLIYGSEWMCVVANSRIPGSLVEHGTPIMLEHPLRVASCLQREQLARTLLHKWTRQVTSRPKAFAKVNFSFRLWEDLPPRTVVDHHHPTTLRDPFDAHRSHRPKRISCRHCAPSDLVA